MHAANKLKKMSFIIFKRKVFEWVWCM